MRETPLAEHYAQRAAEFETIYKRRDDARQAELDAIIADLETIFHGRRILKVACGTGYWTQFAARTAAWITALDAVAEMLDQARTKNLTNVDFSRGDAYRLDQLQGVFDGGLAMFWLSHVPLSRLTEFLDGFHARLTSGAPVYFADNAYRGDCGGELVRRGGHADTYKNREMPDGSRQLIIKNYFTEARLVEIFRSTADDFKVRSGEYYWIATYNRK